MDTRRPPAAVEVDVDLVRRLLAEQHPDLAHEPITPVDEGWDNVVFRLGSELALRLPRRAESVALTLHEQRWLPLLADGLGIPAPVPLRLGVPGPSFPWPWSIVPWLAGTPADGSALAPSEGERLGAALRRLHRPAPDEAPPNPYRGIPLADRREVVDARLARLSSRGLEAAWRRALEVPASEDRRWLHGDLHPRNVLVRDGRIAALIDWGDLTAGDVATDLASGWMLFDKEGRRALFEAYGASDEERARGLGWAVNFASALIDIGQPPHLEIGRRAAARIDDAVLDVDPC